MGEGSQEISYLIAFSAGLLSFVSPCVLPLIPGYLSFITGFTYEDIVEKEGRGIRMVTAGHSLLFIFGFSTVFITLGMSITVLGSFAANYQDLIRQVGGVIIILMGLFVAGAMPTKFLFKEKKFTLQNKPAGLAGSFIVGVTFGAGWTPCVGPILASILIFAGTKNSIFQGFSLLFIYAFGLGLPFFISALAFEKFLTFFRGMSRYMRWIQPISGLFLVGMGILIFFDLLARLVPTSIG